VPGLCLRSAAQASTAADGGVLGKPRDVVPFPRHIVHPSSSFLQNKVASAMLPVGKEPPQSCAVGGYQPDPGKTMQGLEPQFNLLGSDTAHALNLFILPA